VASQAALTPSTQIALFSVAQAAPAQWVEAQITANITRQALSSTNYKA
jgi:hypothetical protein